MTPLTITCTCGEVVRGEDEPTVLSAARRHIAERHPELVGSLSDDDLRQMAARGARASG